MYKSGVIDISGLESLEISDLTAPISIDGFRGSAGHLTLVTNKSGQNVTLNHQVGAASSALYLPQNSNVVLAPNEGVLAFKASQGWHIIRAGYAGLGTLAYQNASSITLDLLVNKVTPRIGTRYNGVSTAPNFRIEGTPTYVRMGVLDDPPSYWQNHIQFEGSSIIDFYCDSQKIVSIADDAFTVTRAGYFTNNGGAGLQVSGYATIGGVNIFNGEMLIGAAPYGMRLSANPSADAAVRITNMLDFSGSSIHLIVKGNGTPFTVANFNAIGTEINTGVVITGTLAVTSVINMYSTQINKYNAGDFELVHRSTGDIRFYTDSATKAPLKIEQLAPTNLLVLKSDGVYIQKGAAAGIALTVGATAGQTGYFYAGGATFWMAAEASVLNAFGVASNTIYGWSASTQAFVIGSRDALFNRTIEAAGYNVCGDKQRIGIFSVPPRAGSPTHFVINTKIPWTDGKAPLLRIRGYTYGAANKISDLSLMWYVYPAPSIFYAQITPAWGSHVPTSVRLDRYTPDGGANYYARLEISNESSYWTHWFVEGHDTFGTQNDYTGWSVADGVFSSPSIYVTTFLQYVHAQCSSVGAIQTYGGYRSTSEPLGYTTGAGNAVVQATSKATGVTSNKPTTVITMVNTSIPADNSTSFLFTNSHIISTDQLIITHIGGGTIGAYNFGYSNGTGSSTITVRNVTPGALAEAILIRVTILRAVNS